MVCFVFPFEDLKLKSLYIPGKRNLKILEGTTTVEAIPRRYEGAFWGHFGVFCLPPDPPRGGYDLGGPDYRHTAPVIWAVQITGTLRL